MKRFCYTISTLALAAAAPALADTRAADLWTEWQAQAVTTGQVVSADVTQTDTGLTLTNFTSVLEQPDVTTRGAIDRIELTENADGTVTVTFSELYSITVTFEVDPGDPPGNIEIQMRHEGLDVRVSGDPGARVYTYSADRLTLTEGAIWGGGGEPPEIDLSLEMTDLNTTYRLFGTDAETMRFSSEGSLSGATMLLDARPPEGEEGYLKMGLVMSALQSTGSGSLISIGSLNQISGDLPPGFGFNGSASYGALDMEFMFEEPSQSFAILYGNEGGRIGFGFSEDAISYDIGATGARARITSADLPAPVELSTASSTLRFQIPVAAGDAPQDVGLRIAVEDLAMGDSLWAMVDPAGAVPRNPASLILDATGQIQLFVNLIGLDPEALDSPPGELRALNVSDLRLSAGGATLSGTADMTFAPGQIVPMPVGSANLQLSGGNALLDTLIASGMVPAQQGAFVRGAIAAFARQGATPDTYETTVDFGADGAITANGVPLPLQ